MSRKPVKSVVLPRGLWVGKIERRGRQKRDLSLVPPGKRPWDVWPEDYYPDYYFRIRAKGLQGRRQSTETGDWSEAVRRAKMEWEIANRAKWDVRAKGLEALTGKRKCCTLGEIFAAYLAGPEIVAEPARIVQSARQVVAMAKGWWTEGAPIVGHGDLARRIDGLPADVLSRELVREYFTAAQGGVFRPMARERVNVTINQRLRKARQLFTQRTGEFCYQGLALPDVEGFMKFPALPDPVIDLEEEMISPEAYLAMLDGAAALEGSADAGVRELALVNRMARELGLRNNEILSARGDWLWRDARSGRWYLDVRDRPEQGYRMKGTEPGKLPLSDVLAGALLNRAGLAGGDAAWRGLSEAGGLAGFLVLPEGLPTHRFDLVQRDHNAWLKGIIGEIHSGKVAHRLRKYVATMIALQEGVAVASQYLRHASETVTLKNYVARMRESLPTITDERLRAGIRAWSDK